MPNLFESAERLYKRLSGNNQAGNRKYSNNRTTSKVDSRSIDGENPTASVTTGASSSPFRWMNEQKNYSVRTVSSSNLIQCDGDFGEDSRSDGLGIESPISPRTQPPGELTAVSSSDEDDKNDGLDYEDEFLEDVDGRLVNADGVYRKSQKLRRSLQKARVSRAADFEVPTNSQNIFPSAEQLNASHEDDESDEDVEEEEDESQRSPEKEGAIQTAEEQEDLCDGFKTTLNVLPRTGMHWPADPPLPLIEVLPKLHRCLGPQTTQFMRAICQRSNCRCLLRGHDTLMVFPVFDAIICEATWEKILDGHSVSRSGSHIWSRLQHHSPAPASETQAKIIMFRQCRGWYEVMNENHEPVPHWSSVEEIRRIRPSTFLVRRELRCLVAPQHLWLPPLEPSRSGNGAPPIPISSSTVSEALNPNVIAASSVHLLKPGTLLAYVDCLPNCTVKRGKKYKQISLVLAVEKPRPMRHAEATSGPRRLFYIGTEEASSQAVFPPKLALSSIAGPENISGVHMLSGILRKFKLPLSIAPVAVPERRNASNTNALSGESSLLNYNTAALPSSKPINIFPTIPGISFSDRNYIRLRGLQQGDILIVAPIDAPDRFFLLTPTLLLDHLFQVGFTEDPIYHKLAVSHRNRATSFLSEAHPRDKMSFLLRYLKNITNKTRMQQNPQLGEAGRIAAGLIQPHEITPALAKAIYQETGKDPRTGPESELPPDQVDQIYEDLEDLYFFTRNGYFPAKARQRRLNISRKLDPGELASNGQMLSATRYSQQRQIPSAEQLLAASLNISTYK